MFWTSKSKNAGTGYQIGIFVTELHICFDFQELHLEMSVDSVDVTVSRNNPGCLVRVCFSFSTRGLPALSAPLSRLPAWFLNDPKKSHPACHRCQLQWLCFTSHHHPSPCQPLSPRPSDWEWQGGNRWWSGSMVVTRYTREDFFSPSHSLFLTWWFSKIVSLNYSSSGLQTGSWGNIQTIRKQFDLWLFEIIFCVVHGY